MEKAKTYFNKLFVYLLCLACVALLAGMTIVILVIHGIQGATNAQQQQNNKPVENPLILALNAGLAETMASGEWERTYAKWFNESKLYQLPKECQGKTYPTKPTGILQQVLEKKKIVFGHWPFVPFVTNTNPYEGVEIDLAKAVVRKMAAYYATDLVVEFKHFQVNSYFDDLRDKLNAGEVDVMMSATTRTKARAEQVAFTCSYFNTYLGLMRTNREPQLSLNSISDVNHQNVIIATLKGTTIETFVRDSALFAQIQLVSSVDELFQKGETSQAHILASDKSSLQYYLRNRGATQCNGCKMISAEVSTTDYYAMWVKK